MEIKFKINSKDITMDLPPQKRLIDVIREDLKYTGTKIGCGEGECGACTVLIDGKTVNSCLIPVFQVNGKEIMTIEGLMESGKADYIKESFMEQGAVQCGYCIPGMVISSYSLLSENTNPSEEEIKTALSGNLCRCTGYKKIVKAVKHASAKRGIK